MLDNVTVLKMAVAVINRKALEKPQGGMKQKDGRIVTFERLALELEKIQDTVDARPTCETCQFTCFPDEKTQMVICYPKGYTSWRQRTDFCNFHQPK